MTEISRLELTYRPDPKLAVRAMKAAASNVRRGISGWAAYSLTLIPIISMFLVFYIGCYFIHRYFSNSFPQGIILYAYFFAAFLLVFAYDYIHRFLTARSHVPRKFQDITVTMKVDVSGIYMSSDLGTTYLAWAGVERIAKFRGGFAFVVNNIAHYGPEDGLPDGITLKEAVAHFEAWRYAALVFE